MAWNAGAGRRSLTKTSGGRDGPPARECHFTRGGSACAVEPVRPAAATRRLTTGIPNASSWDVPVEAQSAGRNPPAPGALTPRGGRRNRLPVKDQAASDDLEKQRKESRHG
jgi:hypothetical protein